MRASLVLALALAVLTGCAPSPRVAPPVPPSSAEALLPSLSSSGPPAAVAAEPAAEACGAAALQHLVGRPRSEIPVPLRPERQRVACTTCPVTQDYDPERLNFRFDATTGLIRQVVCG